MNKVCITCGELKKHCGKGMCRKCYDKDYYQQNREKRIAYAMWWGHQNPEKVVEARRRYYEKHREELLVKAHFRYLEHREKYNIRSRAYYHAHPEKFRAYRRRYWVENREELLTYHCQYRKEHSVEILDCLRLWIRKNPEKVVAQRARRRARKKSLPDTLTGEQGVQVLSIGHCFYCGEEKKLTLDHFVPLGVENNLACGTTLANSVAACKSCNSSKGIKMPQEILKQLILLPLT